MPTDHERLRALLSARVDRRAVLRGGAGGVAALGLPGLAAFLDACQSSGGQGGRPLTPTFYQWIVDEHPAVQKVNQAFAGQHSLQAKIAPVSGFGIQRFVAEAKDKSSTWDIYVGMTPFVEMGQLVEAGVIEPWDSHLQKSVLDDLVPSIRDESTFKGKVYDWPFLLDITLLAWNADIVQKAGLDTETAPKTWDDLVASARKVQQSGAAPFGVTFDAHGWRSLVPITYSIRTDVYDDQGLFDFTSDAAVEALQVMRRLKEVAHPDVLNPGTADGGVNGTPDEGAFTARQVAYYVKYENAPIRMAAKWPDPSRLRMGALPSVPGGAGATVFWDTGAAVFTYGKNKSLVADYMKALTYDAGVWQQSIGAGTEQVGQLPPYQSLWNQWRTSPPAWLPKWAFFVYDQLRVSRAIQPGKWGLQQFVIGQPHWQRYLTGEVADPKRAMQDAMSAVRAEVKKGS